MFTGLITHLGVVKQASATEKGMALQIDVQDTDFALRLGASIACNGVCLTVTQHEGTVFSADVSSETLSVTSLSGWKPGDMINLESALRMGDALGGHLVSGHVDGVGSVANITPQGDSEAWQFSAPKTLMPYIAPKGSITVNGISLTVNQVNAAANRFTVMIVPHTKTHTNLQFLAEGYQVNLEVDLIARYVAQLMNTQQ